ncbi:hypothetical protein MASR2M36_36370 [Providencia sp.]
MLFKLVLSFSAVNGIKLISLIYSRIFIVVFEYYSVLRSYVTLRTLVDILVLNNKFIFITSGKTRTQFLKPTITYMYFSLDFPDAIYTTD